MKRVGASGILKPTESFAFVVIYILRLLHIFHCVINPY